MLPPHVCIFCCLRKQPRHHAPCLSHLPCRCASPPLHIRSPHVFPCLGQQAREAMAHLHTPEAQAASERHLDAVSAAQVCCPEIANWAAGSASTEMQTAVQPEGCCVHLTSCCGAFSFTDHQACLPNHPHPTDHISTPLSRAGAGWSRARWSTRGGTATALCTTTRSRARRRHGFGLPALLRDASSGRCSAVSWISAASAAGPNAPTHCPHSTHYRARLVLRTCAQAEAAQSPLSAVPSCPWLPAFAGAGRAGCAQVSRVQRAG